MTILRQIAFNRKVLWNVQLLQVQYREIATNYQVQKFRNFQTPPDQRHQYHNMIPYTVYADIRQNKSILCFQTQYSSQFSEQSNKSRIRSFNS